MATTRSRIAGVLSVGLDELESSAGVEQGRGLQRRAGGRQVPGALAGLGIVARTLSRDAASRRPSHAVSNGGSANHPSSSGHPGRLDMRDPRKSHARSRAAAPTHVRFTAASISSSCSTQWIQTDEWMPAFSTWMSVSHTVSRW
jgi:hypothetical protein